MINSFSGHNKAFSKETKHYDYLGFLSATTTCTYVAIIGAVSNFLGIHMQDSGGT